MKGDAEFLKSRQLSAGKKKGDMPEFSTAYLLLYGFQPQVWGGL